MIANDLANYASNLKFSDLSKETIHETKRHFIDALACAIGAKNAPPIKIINNTFPRNKRTTSQNALLYGSMIRYLDFNDTYLSKEPAHPADNFGATLAAAQFNNSSTKDFILASALAYEIQCQLCDAASLRKSGWDHVIWGSVSSALASGKLFNHNKEQLIQNLNLNLSTNISSRQVREATELSMWKASAFANVSRNSILFSKLVKQGMHGPNEIFEGKYGIHNMLTGKFKINTKKFGKNKKPFKIEQTWLKNWPAEIHSQSVINGALELRDQINPKDIKSIQIQTHEAGYTIIGSGKQKWKPKTRETADHSIPYLVGAALHFGKITPEVFSKSALNNKKILNIVKKVKVKENKKLTKLYPKTAANIIKIKMKNGKTLKKEVLYHKGHPKNKMSDSELEQKFHKLTSKYLSESRRKQILKKCWNLEKEKNFDWGILGKI